MVAARVTVVMIAPEGVVHEYAWTKWLERSTGVSLAVHAPGCSIGDAFRPMWLGLEFGRRVEYEEASFAREVLAVSRSLVGKLRDDSLVIFVPGDALPFCPMKGKDMEEGVDADRGSNNVLGKRALELLVRSFDRPDAFHECAVKAYATSRIYSPCAALLSFALFDTPRKKAGYGPVYHKKLAASEGILAREALRWRGERHFLLVGDPVPTALVDHLFSGDEDALMSLVVLAEDAAKDEPPPVDKWRMEWELRDYAKLYPSLLVEADYNGREFHRIAYKSAAERMRRARDTAKNAASIAAVIAFVGVAAAAFNALGRAVCAAAINK